MNYILTVLSFLFTSHIMYPSREQKLLMSLVVLKMNLVNSRYINQDVQCYCQIRKNF